ncbi:MAG: PPK2 family polyphosphate kinase [Pseudomonadota bacterium]
MKACDTFRAPAALKLRPSDAALKLIGAAVKDGNAQLDKAEKKALDQRQTHDIIERIAELQAMLYAQRKHKVLLILQGMDTSGKDGTIRSLFSQVNPVGIRVAAFKAPTDIEQAHDYLWRVHQQVPVKGEMTVFNRSHYESVLIERVLNLIDGAECKQRYAQIRDFERMLAETGTVIVKIFLHISKDEQRARLQERIDDPDKNWKFDPADIAQRKKWSEFVRLYERAIVETDTDYAPWYVVPADSKTQRNLAVAAILLETLERLKLDWPAPKPELKGVKID